MKENIIPRILIVRNDSTTAWEESSYILRKGEIGIAYLYDGDITKPIIKVGDGINIWLALPQAERVFETDQIITYNFGKYKIQNGYVNSGGKGKTVSEWLMSALKEIQEPNITQPNYLLKQIIVNTDKGTTEIGNNITLIQWTGEFIDGTYEFGSREGAVLHRETGANVTSLYDVKLEELELPHLGTGTYELETGVAIDQVGKIDLGTLSVKCAWGNSARIPVNNVGDSTNGAITEGAVTREEECSVYGYREGCFYGVVNKNNFIVTDISNELIRGLNSIQNNYVATTLNQIVPSGTTGIIIACPKDFTGPISVLNTTVNAEMFNNFQKGIIEVGGADSIGNDLGKYAIEYDIYYYIPAEPYKNQVELQITLG